MFRGLKKNYKDLAKEYGFRKLNSGDAFHKAGEKQDWIYGMKKIDFMPIT